MDSTTYIPNQWNNNTMLQVRDGELMLYRRPPTQENRDPESLARQRELMLAAKQGAPDMAGQYSGSMTLGARKRMTKAITLLCQSIKPKWITNPVNGRLQFHRVSFVTLTVSDKANLTAKVGHRLLLHPFLQWLTRTKKVNSYVWKAELQKRGQIHYHIIFADFIHYKEIRMKWNSLQREAGILNKYAATHKHANPNSTDIHEMRHVRKTAKYCVKELGKDIDAKKLSLFKELAQELKKKIITKEQYRASIRALNEDRYFTEGKIWDCSDNLSGMGYYTQELTVKQDMLIRGWMEQRLAVPMFGDWFAVIDLDGKDPPEVLTKAERAAFNSHLDIISKGGRKYLKSINVFLN